MNTVMNIPLVIHLVIGYVCCAKNHFDYFVFTQQWPPAACVEAEQEHHKCGLNTSSKIHTWTIHGLWPTQNHTEGPYNCNTSEPFNESLIKPIEEQLDTYWPNLFSDTKKTSFWSHEWNKHGTCAASVSETSNELLYFSMGLKLQKKFDLLSIFTSSGILPDKHTEYRVSDFVSFIKQAVGVKPKVQCAYSKALKKHLVVQIELCLTKTFAPMECTEQKGKIHQNSANGGFCSETEILYPPFPKSFLPNVQLN